jgi:hypothetical protein
MTRKDEPMAIWQRHHDSDDTVDDLMKADREAFVAEHDATFDFEAEWVQLMARAEAPLRPGEQPAFVGSSAAEADRPVSAIVDPDRRSGRRRVLVGAASTAAAAAVLAALVVTGIDDSDGGAELEARIVTATRSALADSIEHEVTDWAHTPQAVDDEAWRDQTTAAVRFLHYADDGSGVSSDTGPAEAPTPAEERPEPGPHPHLTVDYCFDEYAVQNIPIPDDATEVTASTAHALARELDAGTMRTDGTEVVDGQEYIRVVDADGSWAGVYYVDPATNRPVKVVDPEEGYTTTIEYLPRTPALLAAFTPVIPDGLTEVDQLARTDDWRPCS